ncbi:MAG TPA: hypothetical protein VKU00_14470, partial [Chthonomonadaceae bacterium]|nr:hypothetical protein [Chthonomonadaceae bacterium]
MNDKRPSGLIAIAPIVFSLLVGGIAGYFVRYYSNVGMPTTPGAKGGSPPGGLTAPGAGGGMGGGGGGGQQSSSASLVRLVRNLGTIEKVQNKGLTSDQMSKALPILQEIQSADKLPEADCKTKL